MVDHELARSNHNGGVLPLPGGMGKGGTLPRYRICDLCEIVRSSTPSHDAHSLSGDVPSKNAVQRGRRMPNFC